MKKLILLLVTLLPVAAFAGQGKLSPDLRDSNDDVEVIVQYKVQPQQKHRDKLAAHGGQVKDSLDLVKGVVAHVPAKKLADLDDDPDVAYVSPNRPVRSHLNNATAAVIANYAWNLGLDGTGVGVAVIDSGIHLVDDLKDPQGHSRLVYNYDTLGGGNDDQYGHGTHVAGIIAGNGKSSTCSNCDVLINGMAPNVSIINFHALDQNGRGTDASVIKAIDTAIQLQDQLQHPGDESFSRTPGLRELHPGSTLPGGGAGMESRHRGGGGGGQLRPGQLRRHRRATAPSPPPATIPT